MINQDWKLIECNVGGVRPPQLFKRVTNLNGTNDLSDHPRHRENIAVMRNKMVEARQEFEDHLGPFAKFWEGF